MKFNRFRLLAGLLLFAFQAQGQTSDSLKTASLNEVQITVRKPEIFAAGSRQTTLDSAFISLNNGGSISDVLQSRTPVYFKTYGFGMVSTAAFRGTSANHTAVLWNGFNIVQPTLGLTDLALLPVSAVGSVQLQHGSAGANFGSGAIGGAILLNSGQEIKPGLKLGVQQDFGSFGKLFSQINGSYGGQKAGLETSVFHSEAENDFPYTNTARFGNPKERQENARAAQTGFTNNISWQPNAKNKLNFRNWFTTSDFQAQASMASAHNNARNQNRNLRLMAEWQHRSALGNSTVRGAFFDDFMRYQDAGTGVSDSDVKTWQVQAEHGLRFGEKLNVHVGGDAQLFEAEVREYGGQVSEKRASVFALFRYYFSKNLTLNVNWRQAFIQNFNPPPAPSAGLSLALLHTEKTGLHLKGNISRGYRSPTLNERFFPPGNPDIKPEKSWSYEAGLKHTFQQNRFSAESEFTAYYMQVENWIQWEPFTGILWKAQNLKTVEAKGLEYSAKLTYKLANGQVSGGGNYAYTVSEQAEVYGKTNELLGKQLVYVPFHSASAFTDFSYKTWLVTLNWQFTGQRFATADNLQTIDGFQLLSVYAGKTFRTGKSTFQLIGKIHNATNQTYQNLQYYAMPGRHYSLSLRFQLN